jgi:transcriptional regulator with XRE-family HTH domain
MDIGRRLRELRAAAGLTQQALADRLHVSNRLVSHVENGRNFPSVEVLAAWADACGADLAFTATSRLSEDDQALVDLLADVLRSGALDERRRRFLRLELEDYLSEARPGRAADGDPA